MYPCIACKRRFKKENGLLVHWSKRHSSMPDEVRLEGLLRARDYHQQKLRHMVDQPPPGHQKSKLL